MKEQEQQIKNNLISLVNKGVRVIIQSKIEGCERRSNEALKSGVSVRDSDYNTKTSLYLYKEDSLDEWSEAIQKAEHAEAQRVLEREHEYLSPNFYKAILSYVSDLQQD